MTLKYLLALVFLFGLSAVRADDLALSSKVPCSCAELGEKLEAYTNLYSEKLEALNREIFGQKAELEELRRTRYPVRYPLFDGHGVLSLFSSTELLENPYRKNYYTSAEKLEALNRREIFGQKAELEELTHPESIQNHLVVGVVAERSGIVSMLS